MPDPGATARALVTDVHVRSPLHGVRGLGRAGVRVVGVAERGSGAGLWSRYVAERAVAPAARADPQGFRAVVAGLARSEGPLVIFPGNEAALDALAQDDAWVPPGCVLASPHPSSLERLRNKASLAAIAGDAGLRVPMTLAAGTVRALRDASPRMPCVVKPARPNQVLATALVVRAFGEFRALLDRLPLDEELLVQEHVTGPLLAVAVVLDRSGAVVARFQQVAIRTSPPDAGVSALAVSVAPDRALVERAAALLRSVGFWGMAQLQFLDGGGRPALIDVNPRFFGSLSLALKAGVNLPAAWLAVASGAPPTAAPPYRLGIRYRWLEAEGAAVRRHGPSVLRPVPRPVAGGIWAADDPVPSVLLGVEAVRVRVGNLRARLRG